MDKEYYEESCRKAIAVGYKPIENDIAYGDIFFVKDDKKWIHHIEKLKFRLGMETDEELEELGYNCEDYYRYKDLSYQETLNCLAQKEMLEIFGDLPFVNGMVYLSDGFYMTEDGDLIDTRGWRFD